MGALLHRGDKVKQNGLTKKELMVECLVGMYVVIQSFYSSACCYISQVLEGKPIYADCFGNLVPLTKSGQHNLFSFFAFKENRLAIFIKVSTILYLKPKQTTPRVFLSKYQ